MANTISLLNYANTFGDWVVTTNALVKENNDIAANNYHKTSGTLFLDTNTLAFQSNGNAVFAQHLAVQGIGSYLTVQNNTTTNTLSVLTNTTTDTLNVTSNTNTSILSVTDTTYTDKLEANNINASTLNISGNGIFDTISSNTSITTPSIFITSILDATAATISYFNNIQTSGQLSVGGNFVINGTTVYNSNVFTINSGSSIGQNSTFNVNRSLSGANASIRWNESNKYWDILDVNSNGVYSKILTANLITDSITSTSSNTIASSNAIYTLNNTITAALIPYISAAYDRANTSANSIIGTNGTTTPVNGSITLTSTNGITAQCSSNTITINTAQDIRSTANPTFAGLNLSTQPLTIASGGTGQTSQSGALTALLPTGTSAGYVLTTGGPGNFYWSAVGGGGGVTPGTSINSTRLSYVGDGANTKYTTPTFTTGTQLRTYINGVRQFESEYSANSANSTIIFSTAPSVADNILIEIDGYYSNPYYANNIVFTAPFGDIVSSANTIQLAIQDLETRKAALISPAFTGIPLSSTAATGTSNTMIATTAFVNNTANSGATFTHNITGNAGTVTNGVYTNSSYNNPSWITGIANTKITGLITSGQIASITSSHVTTALGYTPISDSGSITGSSGTFTSTTQNSQFNSVGVGTAASTTAGEIRATNNITAYYSSDKKFKENITDIDNAAEIVSHIGGKLFDWTDEYINTHGGEDGYFIQKSDFGVIAQDVQAVFPRAVRIKSDDSLAVDYEKLCALAFAAIRELKAEIDTLKGI